MMRLALVTLCLALPAAASAAPRLLDCAASTEPAFCRQAQAQYREERASPNDYQTMRNVAYCLWTSCDSAFAYDRKQSCVIRRAIMKQHPKKTDRSDDIHFANCVNAGY